MSQFLSYALPGIPYGCTYALIAVGLVLTYRSTGVFNFAFGSEAYAAGVLYAELYWHGVPALWAALLVTLVVAPLFGALLDFGFFSRIPPGNSAAKIVLSLGVMVALPQIVTIALGPVTVYAPPPPIFTENLVGSWGSIAVNGPELSTILTTLVVFLGLGLAMRSRRFGLPIRAAVESPKLLELTGVDSRWVLRGAWMVSTSMAAIAGVLFSSQLTYVDWQSFSVVLVAAIAAAALGGLRSLPLAVLGGIGLGVIDEVVRGYLPTDTIWYSALVPSLPFFILLALLVLHPGLRHLGESTDPMASIEPPPPAPALALRPPAVNQMIRRFRWPFLIAVVLVTLTFTPGPWIAAMTIGLSLSIVFLSITLMTGLAGELSLAQATFAGIGACTTAQLTLNQHVPVLIATLAGGVVAGIGGVAAALPALRLRGLPIALLTLCLALLADNLLFPTSWIGNGAAGLAVPRPHVFGFDLSAIDSKGFLALTMLVLLVIAGAVHLLLRGTTGRALAAVHASPAGAASSGVAVRWMTVLVFMMSATIAGIGGAFFAMSYLYENPVEFNWFYGPTFLVIVVTVGAATVEGAIAAGLAYAMINQVMASLPSRIGGSTASSATITILLLSIGAFTYSRHPEGIVEFVKRRLTQLVLRAKPHHSAFSSSPAEEVLR